MTGKVYLVGAGPGDPELLTIKAARLLKHADVVLHDELVGAEILQLAPAHAQIRNVGKRCGKKNISQEEINFLMVALAASGLQVVRLKGGDPLIFGRIGDAATVALPHRGQRRALGSQLRGFRGLETLSGRRVPIAHQAQKKIQRHFAASFGRLK